MNDTKKYLVFISCPGDMHKEREAAETAVARFSEEQPTKFRFKVFHFGKVASEMGAEPQAIINKQLPNFDVYIGLMGKKFGTPTNNFGSGTEEEFQDAINKKEESQHIYVSFLFKRNSESIDSLSKEELQQYQKMRAFKDRISSTGVYVLFENHDELANEVRKVLNNFIKQCENNQTEQMYQTEMLAEVPSLDVYQINHDFFQSTLVNVGADLSNNQKASISLKDIYVPLHAQELNKVSDDAQNAVDSAVVQTNKFDDFDGQLETKIFLAGEESSGKSAFCKKTFMNFHRKGIIPVLINGGDIKNTSPENMDKLIEKSFLFQYNEGALKSYKQLHAGKKLLIIDDLDKSALNDKHKILAIKSLEEKFSHIIVAVDQIFIFNANLTLAEEFKQLSHFKTYKLRDMGHTVRDALIQRWILAGRRTISDEELYSETEKYRDVIDNILGTNFVPENPLLY